MKKHIIAAAVAASTILSAAAFAAPKTLVYCSEGSPEGFDPALYTGGTTFDASSRHIFNRLVEFKIGTTEIQPALAETWDVSEDGKTVTFHLRKGVTFHENKDFKPTRDFNADDVIATFDRQGNPDNPWHSAIEGTFEYFQSMDMGNLIESIEKVDDYTVVFHLTRPEAPFLANLAMDFASIQSAEYMNYLMEKGEPNKLNTDPIGTGPWVFAGYQQDSTIRYTAKPDHYNGKPNIDRMIFSINTDPSTRWAKVQKGECHVMPYPNPADLEAMANSDVVDLMQSQGLNVGYLAFQTQKEPFTDVKVRKALNMAINKAPIIDAVFQGAGVAAKNPIPPTMWSYNDAVKDYDYDVEGAKALLAEAGYADGFKTDIWAMPVQRPYNPNARRMAELIQADWAKVGVDAEIKTYEWGEYLDRSKKGEQQTVLLGWTGDNGDPDNFLNVLLGCDAVGSANRAQWCNEEFNTLIQKARLVTNQDERAKLYEEAQLIFKDQAPWVTIAHSTVSVPVNKKLKGFVIDPLGGFIFLPHLVTLED
ncbi:MAG: ABC transporter substrate-binding protein [Alphaproteobacteria bacterium]